MDRTATRASLLGTLVKALRRRERLRLLDYPVQFRMPSVEAPLSLPGVDVAGTVGDVVLAQPAQPQRSGGREHKKGRGSA